MSEEELAGGGPDEERPVAEAPTARARALREEIFGAALTLDEAAYILSLDRTTVAKYLREGTLSGFQIGREWHIPENELRAYVRRMAEGPSGEALRVERFAPQVQAMEGAGLIKRVRRELFAGKSRGGGGGRRFDKFTSRARAVLSLAQEEAQGLGHNYIGTEHLLLGLVREGEGVAGRVLADMGVDLEQARGAVVKVLGRGQRLPEGEVGLTPRTKKVIELSVDEARRLGHHHIGTEHLLIGLVREGEGIGAGVLESFGLDLKQVRERVERALASRAPGGTESGGSPPIPPEAAGLLRDGEQGRHCRVCDAASPAYFRFCFNCGEPLDEQP